MVVKIFRPILFLFLNPMQLQNECKLSDTEDEITMMTAWSTGRAKVCFLTVSLSAMKKTSGAYWSLF